jgi:hypothetical protein
MTTMRVATIIPSRGRTETQALARALISLASRGERTHAATPALGD